MKPICLLMSVIFFVTQPISAAPKYSLSSHLKSAKTRFESTQTFQEYVQKSEELNSWQKANVISWLKKQNVSLHNIEKANIRENNFTLTDKKGQTTTITFTDVKRGLFHINDKKVLYDKQKTITENLDVFIKQGSPQSISSLLIPRAEAFTALHLLIGVGIIGVVAGLAWSGEYSPEAIQKDMTSLLKTANMNGSVSLNCSASMSGSEMMDAIQLHVEKTDNTKFNYQIEKRTGKMVATPPPSEKSDDLSEEQRDNLANLAKTCCATRNCENIMNKNNAPSAQEPPRARSR